MKTRFVSLALFSAFAATAAFAQTKAANAPRPLQLTPQFRQQLQASHTSINQTSAATRAAVGKEKTTGGAAGTDSDQNPNALKSIPHFNGAFLSGGQLYPFTMVGRNPLRNAGADVNTDAIAINLQFLDGNGNVFFSLNVDTTLLNKIYTSPVFQNNVDGLQFAEAIQKKEFSGVAKPNWHNGIAQPRPLTSVTVQVPAADYYYFYDTDPSVPLPVAIMDYDFWVSQLNTIFQLENISVDRLPMVFTNNVSLYQGDPSNCCVIGFHGAYDGAKPNSIQTFLWASWIDTNQGNSIFWEPPHAYSLSDVGPLSHEVSEWVNDPFVNNVTPSWQYPDPSGVGQSGFCGGNILETGDPVEVLPYANANINGYWPQTEALLQWFSGSSSLGIYSYPDTTALSAANQNAPSARCGASSSSTAAK
jgi:hypothetical protein